MLPAGAYSQRVRVERRPAIVGGDGAGNGYGPWTSATTVVTRSAAFRPTVTRAQIEAGRETAPLGGVLTLRRDSIVDTIGLDDRVVMRRSPYANRAFAVLSVFPTPDGREVEYAIEEMRP